MKGTEHLILVNASPPVNFFAYPGKPFWCTPEGCKILYLAHANEDGTVALEALADAVKAPKQPLHVGVSSKPDIPNGPLNPQTAGQVIAHYLPNGAIISDEGATAGGGVHRYAANIEPHDHLALTGGAIGTATPFRSIRRASLVFRC
jgi:acetolactate synthase I/II/III large subunit